MTRPWSALRRAAVLAVLAAGSLPLSTAAQSSAQIALPIAPPPAVLTVGPAGSGAAYTDLQAAIDAAPAGAVITVASGEYAGVVVGKPLRIVGAGSDSTFLRAEGPPPPDPFSPAPPGDPALRVHGLAAGEAAAVAGFTLLPAPGPFVSLLVEDCAGSVRLIDLVHSAPFQVTAPLGTAGELGLAVVRDCNDVLMQSCELRGHVASSQSTSALDGLSGIALASSKLTLVACTVRGNGGLGALGGVQLGQAAPGVRAMDASIAIARSYVRGADGGIALFNAGAGAPAVFAIASDVVVAGGPQAGFVGGAGKSNVSTSGPIVQPGGSAVKSVGGALTIASDAGLAGGLGGDLFPAPKVAADGTDVDQVGFPLPTASFVPNVGPMGTPVTLKIDGAPLTPVWPWFSAAIGVALPLPFGGAYLPLELDLATLLPLGVWVLGLTGHADVHLAIPGGSGLVGLVIGVQVIGLSGFELQLSSPTILALGD